MAPGMLSDTLVAAIAWCYLATNALRVFTYWPQILAVWRSRDGARAVSLLTWGSWCVSHLAALLYGTVVMGDPFFVCISAINLLGCSAVTSIAATRRRQARSAATASAH